MSRRFPITPAPPGNQSWRATITMPPPGATVGGGGTGQLKLVQLYCIQQIPTADFTLRVFEIIGATETDTIDWTFAGSEFDYILGGEEGSHFPTMLLAVSGDGGTVSATLNGQPLGTLPYASNADSTCLAPGP